MDRPNQTFKGGKYMVLDNFCYAQFLAFYYLDTKASLDEKNDCQPEVLDDDVSEQPMFYPKLVPLMSSKEKLRCRNVKKVLRYHTPNTLVRAEAYAHHLLMLFYPFRKESDLLSKLNEPDVLNIVNENKLVFEPWGDLVELSLRQFTFQPRTDLFPQQENDEVDNEQRTQGLENEEDESAVNFEVDLLFYIIRNFRINFFNAIYI